MRFFFRVFLAPLVAASLCLPAAAAERKPDLTIKIKTIHADINIDPALKNYQGLYPRLVAAGKRELAKWRGYADKDFRENPTMFTDDRYYEFSRDYDQRSAIQGYISITRTDYSYSVGAAHPNHYVDTLLWDTHARKFTNIRRFFKETRTGGPTMRTLATAIKNAVVADKIKRGMSQQDAADPTEIDTIKPDILKIGAVALAPSTEAHKSSGLIAYFSPYAVGSYVEGFYIEFVPWTAFKSRLSPAGIRLFGGERPPGDAKRHGE